MQRMTSILLLFLLCLAILPATQASAFWPFDDTLVSINGKDYSADDFKQWWKYWNDDKSPLPKTPDPYIDWLLLGQEGKRMDLDSDPGFKRQTEVFLQSRTLLMLQYDDVDSQIKVSEDEIKARYEEKYLPVWQVERLIFKNEMDALTAWQELSSGKLKVDELLARKAEDGGPESTKADWLRPNRIDPGWAAIFRKLKVGEVVDPSQHGNGQVLYLLKDQKGADKDELAKLHDGIRRDIWREKENVKTRELIDKLRDKYQVKVDEERLAALDIHADDKTFTDDFIITSTKQNVSEKQFMAVIHKVLRDRPTAAMSATTKEGAQKLKKETVDNIIAQSVTNWESLDRHYEEKEPFKGEYEFNYNHRLGLALQQRMFAKDAVVSDEEVRKQYDEHPELYTQPTLVKLYIVDETQGPIDQIWADVASGVDFEQVVKKNLGMDLKATEVPENHVDPEVKPIVDKLADGETSSIFKAHGIRVLAHLVKRTPAAPLPFERVKKTIHSKLWKEKLNNLRNAYLDKIKSQTKIEVHEGEWKDIQKELGGA